MLKDRGLVGYWRFEGNADDCSGNNNNGTVYGATQVDGKFGKAYNFDGTQYISKASGNSILDLTNSVTISCWIKTSTAATVNIPSFFTRGRNSYLLTNSNGVADDAKVVLYIYSGGWKNLKGNTKINDNIWHHIVGTYDHQFLKVYLDGILDCTPLALNGDIAIDSTNLYYYIGKYSNSYITSIIDELKIYNRALSEAEIRQDMMNFNPF